MRNIDTRLSRLEARMLRAVVSPIAAEFGVDPDELIEETRRFFTLTDAQQDAEFADALAQAQARGDHDAARLLTDGWAAVRSYRSPDP